MSRFLLAVALTAVFASPALPVWAAPTLTVAQMEFNFGTVFRGESVRHVFAFSNSGDAPLVIEKVASSCGCTAALASARQLAAGESGEIQTSFDSTRFRGEVSKLVYLYTNDPVRPMVQLRIRGVVREEVVLEPQSVNFGAVAARQTVRSSVTLVNQGTREIRLAALQTTAPELVAKLSVQTVAPGERAEIALALTPKPGQGRFSGYVLFKAEGVIGHELRIPVYAELADRSARTE